MKNFADNIDRAIFAIVCLFVMAVLARSACGSVGLHFEPATLTTPTADFTLGLYVSTTEPITGIDYGLDITGATLIGRDLTGSEFPDVLDPTLSGDFGASVADVSQGLDDGDYLIASYRFRVVGFGTTLVKPKPYEGTTGWAGPFPFDEHPFDSFQGSVVTFPEPSALACVLLAIPLFCRWLLRPSSWRQICGSRVGT